VTGTGQKRDRPERFRRNPGACPHSVLTTRGMKGPLPGAKQNTVAKPPLPSIEHENRRLTETYPPGQRRTRIWEIRAQSEGLGVALTSSLNTGFYPSNFGRHNDNPGPRSDAEYQRDPKHDGGPVQEASPAHVLPADQGSSRSSGNHGPPLFGGAGLASHPRRGREIRIDHTEGMLSRSWKSVKPQGVLPVNDYG